MNRVFVQIAIECMHEHKSKLDVEQLQIGQGQKKRLIRC